MALKDMSGVQGNEKKGDDIGTGIELADVQH